MHKGIDVSYANGKVDWNTALNKIDFAIIRCGYGMDLESQDDVQYKASVESCIKLGIPFGVYLYSYANTIEKAQSEAEHVLRLVNPYKDKIKLGIWYDIEDKIQRDLDKDFLEQIINTFCNKIKENGYNVGIYANNDWLRNRISDNVKNNYKIWSASYGNNDGQAHEDTKYSHDNVVMWQFTSNANIDGVGRCDLNYYYDEIDKTNIKDNNTTETNDNNNTDIFNDGLVNCIYDIQEWLNRHYNTNLALDNIYGTNTKSALIKGLQTELNTQFNRGLAVDGIWGPKTYNACVNVRLNAKGNLTYIIQAMLYCKGYDTNGVDGIFGKGTASAVRKFQSDNGLSVDGICGKNTFKALFA